MRTLALLLALLSPLSAADQIELRGIMDLGSSSIYSLYDPSSRSSAWKLLGESFAGYTLVADDRDQGLLYLRNGRTYISLRLVSGGTTITSGQVPDEFKSRGVTTNDLYLPLEGGGIAVILPTVQEVPTLRYLVQALLRSPDGENFSLPLKDQGDGILVVDEGLLSKHPPAFRLSPANIASINNRISTILNRVLSPK